MSGPKAWGSEVDVWMQMQLRPDEVKAADVHWALVEPGAVCNLHCPLCPTGSENQGLTRGLLSLDHFKEILDRLGPQLRYLYLFHNGESLLNPAACGMIAEAASRSVKVLLHAHLSLPNFTEESARKLVASGLHELTVSCDGASQKGYEYYRVGGRFDLVMRNLRWVLKAKKDASSELPAIVWKFLVNRGNRHEVGKAERMAREFGIPIRFMPLVYTEAEPDRWSFSPPLEPHRLFPDGRRVKEEPYRGICLNPWDEPFVHADGMVLPCCEVSDPKWSLGNIFKETLGEIWNKPLVKAMRRYLRDGKESPMPLPCHGCPLDPNKGRSAAEDRASSSRAKVS